MYSNTIVKAMGLIALIAISTTCLASDLVSIDRNGQPQGTGYLTKLDCGKCLVVCPAHLMERPFDSYTFRIGTHFVAKYKRMKSYASEAGGQISTDLALIELDTVSDCNTTTWNKQDIDLENALYGNREGWLEYRSDRDVLSRIHVKVVEIVDNAEYVTIKPIESSEQFREGMSGGILILGKDIEIGILSTASASERTGQILRFDHIAKLVANDLNKFCGDPDKVTSLCERCLQGELESCNEYLKILKDEYDKWLKSDDCFRETDQSKLNVCTRLKIMRENLLTFWQTLKMMIHKMEVAKEANGTASQEYQDAQIKYQKMLARSKPRNEVGLIADRWRCLRGNLSSCQKYYADFAPDALGPKPIVLGGINMVSDLVPLANQLQQVWLNILADVEEYNRVKAQEGRSSENAEKYRQKMRAHIEALRDTGVYLDLDERCGKMLGFSNDL